jgi:cation transport ATPase
MMATVTALPPAHRVRAWCDQRLAGLLLGVMLCGLAAGGALRLTSLPGAAERAWLAVGGAGAGYAAWGTAASLRNRRVAADLIALPALAGAIAVGAELAAGIIAVMVAAGHACEARAGGRARRDLTRALGRAPRAARRYAGQRLQTVPVAKVMPGDTLLVVTGEVIPVDGTVTRGQAVLDESALTGEPWPVEHPPGDPVRSGVINAGGAFTLRATARAADSTHAGVARLASEAEQSQTLFVRMAGRSAVWLVFLRRARP